MSAPIITVKQPRLNGWSIKEVSSVAQTETEWLNSLAAALGIEPPTAEERDAILSLAATAAHVSERTAAPISCWLVARAGLGAAEGKALADKLAGGGA
ncbi:MAG: hypothetical protein EPN30_10350 [Actinomycetota bacterium]|nr:MAG: hypothetical protein EPN30_10350 [Actinomycetota bacterium]